MSFIESSPSLTDFLMLFSDPKDSLHDDQVADEIMNVEHLERYAENLGRELKTTSNPLIGHNLLPEVNKSCETLLHLYLSLTKRMGKPLSPAAEWFVDNFHVIDDQLRSIKRDLPKNYYDELPKLESGPLKGYPRVYAVTLSIIYHTDARLEIGQLKKFIKDFQKHTSLTIGELWAVAITLRISLIKRLEPLVFRVVNSRQKRDEADKLADHILEIAIQAETKPEDIVKVLSKKLLSLKDINRSFIVQLIQRLRDQDPSVYPAFDWLEDKLKDLNTNSIQVIQLEHYRQAADQVTIGNIITSMRLISNIDWHDFLESVSLSEPILRQDPSGDYSKMDKVTRDMYRKEIERISKGTKATEIEISQKILDLSKNEAKGDRKNHIGYFLLDKGKEIVEKDFHYSPKLKEHILRFISNNPTSVYLGTITFLCLILLSIGFRYNFARTSNPPTLLGIILLMFIPLSELTLGIINQLVTILTGPRTLPRIDILNGIPAEAKAMVVVPSLFTNEHVVKELLENLEVHYLANQDNNLYFALLGDLSDSSTETNSQDKILLEQAHKGIEQLNLRYSKGDTPIFYVFHRARKYNSSEEKWIGWERKRGKLLEFNKLLRGNQDTTYLPHHADQDLLTEIKYVITLDADTLLPRDAAHKLIGTIIHPLNRPVISLKENRVVNGYGIIQPRISVSLTSSAKSEFAKIFSGITGLDPYTTAVSDVYQDLFAEGSFTGKGLYDVDAFDMVMHDRVPENTVLSHDLFEGSFARAALITDVELIDEFPTEPETYFKRLHRWTRGDWQLLPWLLRKVPNSLNEKIPNTLPMICRWKIFDNLRRSLVAPSLLLWLILGWTILPGDPAWWTLGALIILCFPIYTPILLGNLLNFKNHIKEVFVTVVFLPRMGYTEIDAIVRSLYRKYISKKRLLEWVTFHQLQNQRRTEISLSPVTFLSLGLFFLIIWKRPESIYSGGAFLLLWMAEPVIKSWSGKRTRPKFRGLTEEQTVEYRRYARKTWHFFERFVCDDDNWLAPDNFQEDPDPVVARRTSPTNIGLQLLSTCSAFDMGYIGFIDCVERLEKTFESISKLETLNGHLYNWYDTQTLTPLTPRYISTVDSGNLAGHLICLKQFFEELKLKNICNENAISGLKDSINVLESYLFEIERIPSLPRSGSLKRLYLALENIRKDLGKTTWFNLHQSFIEARKLLSDLDFEGPIECYERAQIWMEITLNQIQSYQRDLQSNEYSTIVQRLSKLSTLCDEIAQRMDFKFLFDEARKIFSIGFNVTDGRRDYSFYDLLASESRLASFFAIAKGDVPQEHWFRLGRQMTQTDGGRALVSWTATMFEYLMPLLVMNRYEDTLLDETYAAVVDRQIEYGNDRGVPWGVSEAGYNARDLQYNYQYGPFGVPGLGLKRGLRDDLVISPYSTMLASPITPWEALHNLKKLERIKALGKYGFYESIDYTAERIPKNEKHVILKSYMAHHQGMSLVSISNLLNRFKMQKRFHTDPLVQSTQLLLQEKIPVKVEIVKPRAEEAHADDYQKFSQTPHVRLYTDPNLSTPRTQLLSNGTYSVMITSAGSGFSRCGDLAISRWREDSTRDNWGQFFYIKNKTTGKVWSSSYLPLGTKPRRYEVVFSEDRAEIHRQDNDFNTQTEVIVSSEDNVELRRISLTNKGNRICEIEVTSYMEAVFARTNDDIAHPAFSNLFIQTEFIEDKSALLAYRRQRSHAETEIWGFHNVYTDGEMVEEVQCETDRVKFLGRGQDSFNPLVMSNDIPLSNSTGSVLDPIFSLRKTVKIKPNETVRMTFSTGLTFSRDEAIRLVTKYHDDYIFNRESNLGWIKSQVQLRHLNISIEKAHVYQRLAGRILYLAPYLRANSQIISSNTKTQSALWAYGISGDYPIILTRIHNEKDMVMIRDLLRAHEYIRLKGIKADLVILNEHSTSYMQSLSDELMRQILISGSHPLLDKPGGIFIRKADHIPHEDLILLKSISRIILVADKGTLTDQLKRRPIEHPLPEKFFPTALRKSYQRLPFHIEKLEFFNGIGGFSNDGKEYVIKLKEDQWTPAPWINVIANQNDFGFQISESGAGFTWSINSRENRITSWSNDAVSDPAGEIIYLRDEETGEYWSPTPLPIRGSECYVIRHGQGYSKFEHISHGLAQELLMFVPVNDSIKIMRLKLKNQSDRKRNISVTYYVEWVLGVQRFQTAPIISIFQSEGEGPILAKNSYNNEFSNRIAFADMSITGKTFTCDRKEFLGRNGHPKRPQALERKSLSNRYGAGLDPCTAIQGMIEIPINEEKEVIIVLGDSGGIEEARELVKKYLDMDVVEKSFTDIKNHWEKILGTIQINTPDLAMNILMNRWLLYQTLVCRIWARSAFYQSGGAFGFRDQLQDVMAMVYSKPEITRNQIILAASRQFVEGDVQHWWHPPTGRGVRTRFSDDLLWLPFVTSFYLKVTNDTSILKEEIPFITTNLLEEGHDETYTEPKNSDESASLYEHCIRTIERSLQIGVHGLPLMGSGDWNDGMNRVGNKGRGESVWMAWFLLKTLKDFLHVCKMMKDEERANRYKLHIQKLKESVEAEAWDGKWYRRAYFDSGEAMGSESNDECKIDSIAQSWGIISQGGNPERTKIAMAAVDQFLVDRKNKIIKLFTPPFDKGHQDPGYIKGYVPGVRENGGQYTHAAIWTMMAFADLDGTKEAWDLYNLINPIHHASTHTGSKKYKVEPYVIAADIYGLHPHLGRGGWTWYTGSASWMYRAGLESLLGFKVQGHQVIMDPKLAPHWEEFQLTYQFKTTTYELTVKRSNRSQNLIIDLVDDGKIHKIDVLVSQNPV